MPLSTNAIDRIVANVLNQLGGQARVEVEEAPQFPSSIQKPHSTSGVKLSDKVLTADSFENVSCDQAVIVQTNAIITPAAFDIIKERRLQIVRSDTESKGNAETMLRSAPQLLNCYVVKHTESLERAISELSPTKRDLLGCPDDAAQAAISAICRGDANAVLIFVEQVHRAACLANRNEKVKAVVVSDGGDVKDVREQLRANVWCVNPEGRSYFELKNLFKAIVTS